MLPPVLGKFAALAILCAFWLAQFQRINRLSGCLPYHVASYQRDRRKSRFYYLSVWIGLLAATLSFLSLEALQAAVFDTANQREWVFNILRGLGLWGLFTIAMVWSQVGVRASQTNSDGQSLTPLPEPRDTEKKK